MKILIADDDEFTMALVQRKLQTWGYKNIETLDNGSKALDYLNGREEPLIAILDWMMPEKNGNEVFQELNTENKTPLFKILLTAKNTTEEMRYGLDCGADRYLTKPIDFQTLKEVVEEGLSNLSSS